MSPLNITQPLGIWSINVYNGYYKVMSNIPKMGHLPTPVDPGLKQGSWGTDPGLPWELSGSPAGRFIQWKIPYFKMDDDRGYPLFQEISKYIMVHELFMMIHL